MQNIHISTLFNAVVSCYFIISCVISYVNYREEYNNYVTYDLNYVNYAILQYALYILPRSISYCLYFLTVLLIICWFTQQTKGCTYWQIYGKLVLQIALLYKQCVVPIETLLACFSYCLQAGVVSQLRICRPPPTSSEVVQFS